MPEEIARSEGRALFGLDPEGYDDSRPDYPEWIFECLRDRGVIFPGAATVEIGPGSGKATRSLLRYGADPLTLIEPEGRFARMLESLTSDSTARCRLIRQVFEDVDLPEGEQDLVVAATSFHWIEPRTGLAGVRRLLKPDGSVALIWNVLQVLGREDTFHEATRELMAPLATSPSGMPDQLPYALDRDARESDARAAGFARVDYFESCWTYVVDTRRLVRLYEGFSHVQRLDPAARAELLDALAAIAATRFGGRVERNVTSCLYLLTRG